MSTRKLAYPLANPPNYPKGHPKAGKPMSVKDMNPAQLDKYRADQEYTRQTSLQHLAENPGSAGNLVDTYDQSNPEERGAGRNWFPGANHVAHQIAADASHNTGKDITADQVVGLLALYSPKTNWHDNMHAASLAAHGVFPGTGGAGWKSPADGKGMMTTDQQSEYARRIMAGEDWRKVIGHQKIGNFGVNIASGGVHDPNNQNGDQPYVTIDRHMLSATHGTYADEGDYLHSQIGNDTIAGRAAYNEHVKYVADATDHVNQRDGSNLSPTQMQATTWVTRQRLNGETMSSTAATNKKRFDSYAAQMHPTLVNNTPGVGFVGGESGSDNSVDMPFTPTYHGMPTAAQGGSPHITMPTGPPGVMPQYPGPEGQVNAQREAERAARMAQPAKPQQVAASLSTVRQYFASLKSPYYVRNK